MTSTSSATFSAAFPCPKCHAPQGQPCVLTLPGRGAGQPYPVGHLARRVRMRTGVP